MTSMALAPAATGGESRTGRRRVRLAATLWLSPYFFAVASFGANQDVILPTRFVEWFALGTLALVTLIAWLTKVEVARLTVGLGALVVVGALYLLLGAAPNLGQPSDYIWSTVVFCVIYGLTMFYGAALFREADFVQVFFRLSVISAVIAVVAYGASIALGRALLVNYRGHGGFGDFRLQGFLAEPSAWAPIVPVLLILGWRRKSRWALLLGLSVLLLAQSPSVLLVTSLSLAAYGLLVTTWSRNRVPIVVLILAGTLGGGVLVANVDGRELQANGGNIAVQFVGRLLTGVQAVLDGSDYGDARVSNTQVVLDDARAEGNPMIGYGLNASSTYFEAKYPGEGGVRPNAIWVRTAFDLGWLGATLLLAAMVVAAVKVARRPELAAILIPIFIASMITGGHQLNKMVLLGVLLFALGWDRKPSVT